MRRPRLRAILVAAMATGCLMSTGAGSTTALLTSTRSAGSNIFTTGYWACRTGSAVLATANGSTVKDTYVDQHSPTTNYGTANPLAVNGTGSKEQRMLLQFTPLPTLPTSCRLTTATLTVYTSTAKPGLTYNIYNVAAPWVDSVVTWDSQPAPSGSPVSVPTAGVAGPTAWTVTALVAAQYAGTPNNGFIVEDPTPGSGYSNSTNYASNEAGATQAPTLTIHWGP